MRIGYGAFRHGNLRTAVLHIAAIDVVSASAQKAQGTLMIESTGEADEKKPAVFCPLCWMWLNSPHQYSDHLVVKGSPPQLAKKREKNFRRFLKAFEKDRFALKVEEYVNTKGGRKRKVAVTLSTMIAEHEKLFEDETLPHFLADRGQYARKLEQVQEELTLDGMQ